MLAFVGLCALTKNRGNLTWVYRKNVAGFNFRALFVSEMLCSAIVGSRGHQLVRLRHKIKSLL